MNLSHVSQITHSIKVSVSSYFQDQFSNAELEEFAFSYRITLENMGEHPVQLISRVWYITDSLGPDKVVEGEGVVGEQPVIIPGEKYEYVSWCQISSELGKMKGYYLFKDLETGESMNVSIPEFTLHAGSRLN